MKSSIKFISVILVILMFLSSCAKITEVPDDTTAKKETTAKTETTKAEDTTENVPDDTTAEETTAADTTPPAETTNSDSTRVTSIKLDKYEVKVSVGQKDMPMVTMYPENATNVAEIWKSDNEKVATVDRFGNITGVSEGKCTVTVTSEDNRDVKAEVKVTVEAAAQVKGVTYIQGVLVVNKTYALPADYNPGVDATASAALQKMFAAAQQDGISLWIASAFRSYSTQQNLYNNYVARDGKAEADRYSARPGHSEHQTGLAFDLNSLEQSFGQTPEGKWLAANCWKYGFIIRFPEGKEAITGYMYEPWHVRYLGEDVAKKVYNSGLTLEEYLGIDSKYAN